MALPLDKQLLKIADNVTTDILANISDVRSLLEELADFFQDLHTERFKQGVDPRSKRWNPLSPLTLALYKKQGIGTTKPGGRKLAASFEKGKPGNVRKISSRKLEYGSNLRAGRVFVVIGFQDDYFMPKSSGDVEKRNKIRAFIGGTLEIPFHAAPPLPDNANDGRLHHPARVVVGLEEPHDRQIGNIVDVWIEDQIDQALGVA